MKQVWIPKIGAPEVLEQREAETPSPAANEVLIEVVAAGVNFADLMARMGLYADAPPLPSVVGYEVSGHVAAVGSKVDRWSVGDAVVALTRFGGYSTHVCVADDQLTAIPDGLDVVTAAAIPVTGVTAWMMLEEMGRVRRGDRVLVHSAGGGVGLMALDILRWRGAVAVGTASAAKHERLLELGYHQLVDYRTESFGEVLADGPGFDLILDPVGGASWASGFDLLRPGGRMICFGMSNNAAGSQRSLLRVAQSLSSVPWTRFNPITLMNENKGVMGVNLGRMWDERARIAGWMSELMALWSAGDLRPHVHATVPMAEAAHAHQMIHDRQNFGKVLLLAD